MERSFKEREKTERSERERTRCPTLPITDYFFKNVQNPSFKEYSPKWVNWLGSGQRQKKCFITNFI